MSGTLAAPAGNPTALAASVDRYEATERAIASAADDLMRVVMEGQAESIKALNKKATKASGHLNQAHGRYQGTRSALRSYTVELVTFHNAAKAAIEREHSAREAVHYGNQDLTEAAQQARTAALNPQDQATLDHWQTQAHLARHRVDAAEATIAAAHAQYYSAADALEDAAQRAMALIEASFEGTNDSRMDRIKKTVAAVVSLVSNLADWVSGFFKAAFDMIAKAVAIFLAAVLLVVAVVVVIALLVVLLAAALVLIVDLISGLLATLAILFEAWAFAYGIATILGVDDLTRIRIVLAALAIASPALGLFILSRIADELSKPTPHVSVLDPGDLKESSQRTDLKKLDSSEPDSVDDFLQQAGEVDTVGGKTQTVVDIAKIVHEDGSVSWIVTLPSTQDWVLPFDQGATNDLDADLLLLAFPELQTQYEKAVLKAMSEAHIGAGEPVLVTGWSLGGIMAGHLAETGAGGYDYAGVVVAGAPIDHMNISADIPVIQVKHTTDPVHRADMIDDVPDQGSHITLWDGDRSGIGLGLKTEMMGHNSFQYHETLEQHVTANESINDAFGDFFVVDDPNHAGKPAIEHTQYAFSE